MHSYFTLCCEQHHKSQEKANTKKRQKVRFVSDALLEERQIKFRLS